MKKLVRESLTENFNPATKRQLWALYLATKQDYRNQNLSYEDAAKLISDANAKSGYTKKDPVVRNKVSIEDELLNYLKDNSKNIFNKMSQELGIKSVIHDDPAVFGKERALASKKYAFFGGGMGFAHIDYDKRSKLAGKIYGAFRKIENKFLHWFINEYFTKKEQMEYEKMGWPLYAMMSQNLSIKAAIAYKVVNFMESKGIKRVSVRTIYD